MRKCPEKNPCGTHTHLLAHSLIDLYLLLTSYYELPPCRNESPPVLLSLHLSSLLILFSGHKVDKLTDKIDQFIDQSYQSYQS